MTEKAGQFGPSRRKLLLSLAWATVLTWTGMFFGDGETVQAQQKVSKEQAKYQDSPKGDQKCSNCNFFIEPNACQTVEGEISPEGWCQLWVEKQ